MESFSYQWSIASRRNKFAISYKGVILIKSIFLVNYVMWVITKMSIEKPDLDQKTLCTTQTAPSMSNQCKTVTETAVRKV